MNDMMTIHLLGVLPIGSKELLILLCLLAFSAIVIAVIFLIVKATGKPPGPPTQIRLSSEARLDELEALRAKSLITDDEFQVRRQKILAEL